MNAEDDLIVAGHLISPELRLQLKPYLKEPSSLSVIRQKPIGGGNFGTIHLGKLTTGKGVRLVAVKTLKGSEISKSAIEKFLKEAVILKGLKHDNVLSTLAVCIPDRGTPQVVLPFMRKRDLKRLLGNNNGNFTVGDLTDFGKQVSCGMAFLAKNRIVHRDVAARNCLVDGNYTVKIADFGLTIKVNGGNYFRLDSMNQVKLPLKWLALESLTEGVFSSKSDVWSYGVLMWEIYSRGAEPYNGVAEIEQYLTDGRRLQKPDDCPEDVWELMERCWLENPEERPIFADIHEALTNLPAGYDWDNALAADRLPYERLDDM